MWHVYLIRCADETLYCGVATDVTRRLRQHNGELAGGARYTRGRGPVQLVASAACADRGAALRLEAHIKSLPRQAKASALATAATATTTAAAADGGGGCCDVPTGPTGPTGQTGQTGAKNQPATVLSVLAEPAVRPASPVLGSLKTDAGQILE